jgi:C-terminal processing protease CtpA/Prc
MSNLEFKLRRRDRRINLAGYAWIPMALVVMAACSGETPVTPGSEPQADVQAVPEPNYSFSISTADRTVHVRFTRVRSDGIESVSSFMQRMFASADSTGATRLVLDLRSTRGGDAFLIVPLLKGVLARERFAQTGGLVVLVGPESFSPGQSAASMLQRYAKPVFVGESTI